MKKFIVLLLCISMLLLCSCASYITETPGDDISPLDDSPVTATKSLPLYFRFYSESLLVRVPTPVETSPQQEAEYYAIRSLLSGPSGQRSEIVPCFSKKTQLVGVESNENYLYVTLSSGFLSDTENKDPEITRQNRRLALYSIVNTVCEMGKYSAVQFFIASDGATARPDAYLMGVSQTDDGTTLGPLTRLTSIILTPSVSLKNAITHFSAAQWDKLYIYFTGSSDSKEKLPILEEMTKFFEQKNITVSEFAVEDNYTVSDDGKTAYVQVSLKIKSSGTQGYNVTDFPVKMINKNNCWFVSYNSFVACLEVTS